MLDEKELKSFEEAVKVNKDKKKNLDENFILVSVRHVDEMVSELRELRFHADKGQCIYCGHIGNKDHGEIAKHIVECKENPLNVTLDALAGCLELLRRARTNDNREGDWRPEVDDFFSMIESSKLKNLNPESRTGYLGNVNPVGCDPDTV